MQRHVLVDTVDGTLQGIEHAGVVSFLGVHYGGDTGVNRFAPPTPVVPWSGVRDATRFGDAAPQNDGRLDARGRWADVLSLANPRTGSPLEGGAMSEDCLVLNVWTPAVDDGVRRPVMVWLHGGAFVSGTGSETQCNGDVLAPLGDVVVVTLNHRLGLLGYLPIDRVDPTFPSAGVAGMLDIVQALEWVRDNIASFGGDPGNVTVFGHSGGGAKISTLLAMPAAAGLFHKVVIQSGAGVRMQTEDDADALLERVLELAGLPKERAHRLAELDADRLLTIQKNLNADGRGPFRLDLDGEPEEAGGRTFNITPAPDAKELPTSALDPAGVDVSRIPMLIGHTSHEMAMLLSNLDGWPELTEDRLRRRLRRRHGEAGDEILEQLLADFPDEPPRLLLARDLTNGTSRIGTLRLAERKAQQAARVYLYEFGYQTPVLDGLLGAPHSIDISFTFSTVGRTPFSGERPDRHEVARAMSLAWAAFARTGDPTDGGGPAWAPYDETDRNTMFIGTEWRSYQGPSSESLGRPAVALWS